MSEPTGDRLGRAHLVGIGGAGHERHRPDPAGPRQCRCPAPTPRSRARSLALRAQGATIDIGHDRREPRPADRRADRGGRLHRDPGDQPGAGQAPAARDHRCCTASQALAALMAGHRVACVAGTHGKTSTTSMLTVALQHCGSTRRSRSAATSTSRAPTPTTAPATCSSPRPTRATARSCCSPRRSRSSPTSRPTTWTTTAPSRRTPRCSRTSSTASSPAACWSPAPTTRARRGWPCWPRRAGSGCAATADRHRRGRRDPGRLPARRRRRCRHRVAGRRRVRRARSPFPASTWRPTPLAALLAGLELGVAAGRPGRGLAAFGGVRRRFELKGRRRRDPRLRRLRPPPDRGGRAARGRPARRGRRAGGGGLPAAPVLADPDVRRPSSRQALALADEVVVLDVFGAREDPEPGVNGALVADAGAAAAGAGALRAVVRARCSRWSPRWPVRATWC